MSKIFISYSRADREFVYKLIERLRRVYGHETIWYDKNIKGGEDWWNNILKEIDKCDLFIYLVSNESIESEYCHTELKEALRLNKSILPIRITQLNSSYQSAMSSDLIDVLSTIQYIDMSQGFKNQDSVDQMYASINELIDKRELIPGKKLAIFTITGLFLIALVIGSISVLRQISGESGSRLITPTVIAFDLTTTAQSVLLDTQVASTAMAGANLNQTSTATAQMLLTSTQHSIDLTASAESQTIVPETERAIVNLTATEIANQNLTATVQRQQDNLTATAQFEVELTSTEQSRINAAATAQANLDLTPNATATINAEPCFVFTDETDVGIHVGPNVNRPIRQWFPLNEQVLVTGQYDDNGDTWFLIEPEGFNPLESDRYWVIASDIIINGNCMDMPVMPSSTVVPPSSSTTNTVQTSTTCITDLTPTANVTSGNTTFSWTPLVDATEYVLVLYDAANATTTTFPTDNTSYTLNIGQEGGVGGTFYWEVRAYNNGNYDCVSPRVGPVPVSVSGSSGSGGSSSATVTINGETTTISASWSCASADSIRVSWTVPNVDEVSFGWFKDGAGAWDYTPPSTSDSGSATYGVTANPSGNEASQGFMDYKVQGGNIQTLQLSPSTLNCD